MLTSENVKSERKYVPFRKYKEIIVIGIGVIASLILSEEIFNKYIHNIAIGLGGGSGGLAMALTQQLNSKSNNENSN